MDLFDEEKNDFQIDDKVTINKRFAAKYDKRKKAEDLAKAMVMSDSDSEESSEDEDAQLITPAVERTFLDTLAKIKKNDPSLKAEGVQCFRDDDFDLSRAAKEKKEKRMTARDVQREMLLSGGAEAVALEEERVEKMSKLKTPMEEEEDLRKAFMDAGNVEEESDDDLFTTKKKSKAELAAEAQEDAQFAEAQDAKRSKEEKDMLNRVWEAPEEELSEKDKFLRSYFLEKKWEADTDRIQGGDDGFNSDAGSSGSEEFLENSDTGTAWQTIIVIDPGLLPYIALL